MSASPTTGAPADTDAVLAPTSCPDPTAAGRPSAAAPTTSPFHTPQPEATR